MALLLTWVLVGQASVNAAVLPAHAWPHGDVAADTVAERFGAPAGFERAPVAPGSFGAWLRALPLRPGRGEVRLYDGTPKENQRVHAAVIDIDVGARDLQQCADAAIRLHAEYLWAVGRSGEICYRAVSGDAIPWRRFRDGERPRGVRNRIVWERKGRAAAEYASFREYLDAVFTWAGTPSLARDMAPVARVEQPEPGDVVVRGGSPGHAVIVIDVAQDEGGARVFLLAQSFMPAQDIHVLNNPADATSPWYAARGRGEALITPEWRFDHADLRRFPADLCRGAGGKGHTTR